MKEGREKLEVYSVEPKTGDPTCIYTIAHKVKIICLYLFSWNDCNNIVYFLYSLYLARDLLISRYDSLDRSIKFWDINYICQEYIILLLSFHEKR